MTSSAVTFSNRDCKALRAARRENKGAHEGMCVDAGGQRFLVRFDYHYLPLSLLKQRVCLLREGPSELLTELSSLWSRY